MTPIRLPDGRWVVPQNRWDLVRDHEQGTPEVSVVIPYFDQQPQLDLVLSALTLQTHPTSRLQVIVADDGSARPPDTHAAGDLDVSVVRQDDRGFRAAAARNLGARASDGSILCFLDSDTVPAPDYVEKAARLPNALPDALVVGRRRHADLTGWTPAALRSWLIDGGRGPHELPEPLWLREAYARSRDLLDADHRSYRHIISAVMACTRSLFDDVSGFEEAFIGYGGEDWEFAHRAWDGGAVLAHQPSAIAWHDGPDWAERNGDDRIGKNAEALALARFVTDPAARTHGLVYAISQVTAIVDSEHHSAASLLVTVGSLLAAGDVRVWVTGPDALAFRQAWGDCDSRIRVGRPTGTQRSRVVLTMHGRYRLSPDTLAALIDIMDTTGTGRVVVAHGEAPAVTVAAARAINRGRRWAAALHTDPDLLSDELFGVMHREIGDLDVQTVDEHPRLAW